MRLPIIFGLLFSLLSPSPAFAQDNQINRQNRTIEVMAPPSRLSQMLLRSRSPALRKAGPTMKPIKRT
jgi:hypothetical protein